MQNKSFDICVVIRQTDDTKITSAITTHYTELAQHLVSEGNSVVVCNAGNEVCSSTYVQDNYTRHGVDYFDLKDLACDASLFLLFSEPLQVSYKLNLWLSGESFDVVHFPDYQGVGFFALRSRRIFDSHTKTRFVMTMQAPIAWIAEKNFQFLDDPKTPFMERYCSKHADAIVWSCGEIHRWIQYHKYSLSEEQYDLQLLTKHNTTSNTTLVQKWMEISFGKKQAIEEQDKTQTEPLVSICMPHFNHADYLPMALESLNAQSYTNLELIIVDDGSTDDKSKQVFAAMQNLYSHRKNWRFFYKGNGGPERCRNYAVQKTNGEYLIFMDSDNIATKEMVETYVSGIIRSKTDCLSCWFYGFYGHQWENKVDYVMTFLGACVELGWKDNCFGDTNFIIRKDVFTAIGGFSESPTLRGNEDWEFLAKLCLSGYDLDVVDVPIFWYRNREDGINQTTNHISNRKRIAEVYDAFCPGLRNIFCNSILPIVYADESTVKKYRSTLKEWESFDGATSNCYIRFGRGMARLVRGVLRRLPSFCERSFFWIVDRL